MGKIKIAFCLLLGVVLITNPICLPAQTGKGIPVGAWRMHTPFNSGFDICEMEGRIYVGTSNGLFYYDKADQSVNTLTKINGLSGIGISCMAKHPTRNLIMVGYEDGNLDLVEGNNIYNAKDIVTGSNIIGSKKINRIKFWKDDAILSCEFGLVIFNITKREIRESNIAFSHINSGTTIPVRDCIRFNNFYYALTAAEGLKVLSVKEDLKNTPRWQLLGSNASLPAASYIYQTIDSVGGKLVITTLNNIHVKEPLIDNFPFISLGGDKRRLRFFENKYYLCVNDVVLIYETPFADPAILRCSKFSALSDCFVENETIWLSDLNNGLIRISPGDTTVFEANAPAASISFSLTSYQDKIVSCAGGYLIPTGGSANGNRQAFSIFNDNRWTNYHPALDSRVPDFKDITSAVFNPSEQKLYLSSFGDGIYTKQNDSYFLLNDSTTNAGLCNVIFDDCIYNFDNPIDRPKDRRYVKVAAAAFDLFGGLWAANYEAKGGTIRRRNAAGEWLEPLVLRSANGEFPLDIKVDRNNYKWVRMAPTKVNSSAGIWVINSDGTRTAALNSNSNQGGLPSNDVYDLQEDKQGYMWVGTGKGLAVYYNPFNVFYTGGVTASTPIYPPEAGRPVLENDVVTSIEIDGGNRKWVGTKDNGLWLFNADITKVIHHFTTQNSPLLSNYIYDLAINKPTGELFIATEKGLISFQADATENVDESGNPIPDVCENENINIFPNPVKKGFDGVIAVQGLAANSEVKFVTPAGKLVYKTTAIGGMATWNGYTYDGKKAHPGIYLVLSSTTEGGANCVSKLAIMN